MRLTVYVPTRPDRTLIDAGSGIVGTHQDDRVLVDYEGSRDAVNILTYADRVHHAADRHTTRYPTTARMLVPAGDVLAVGTFDPEAGEVDLGTADLTPEAARTHLAAWIGVDAADLDPQLRTEGSMHHQIRREIAAALASPNPAVRFAGQQMAKRHNLPG